MDFSIVVGAQKNVLWRINFQHLQSFLVAKKTLAGLNFSFHPSVHPGKNSLIISHYMVITGSAIAISNNNF